MKIGHFATGTITADGSAHNESIGFQPSFLIIFNETDPGVYLWTDTMANAEMVKLTDAVALTFPTTNGISAYAGAVATSSQGFTIGADSDMNGASDVLHYVAFGKA